MAVDTAIQLQRSSAIALLLRKRRLEPEIDEDFNWLLPTLDEARERQQVLWEEPRPYIRASGAGDPCPRSISLTALGHRVPHDARRERIFAVGRKIEEVNIETMRLAGVLVKGSPQLKVSSNSPPVVGHIDALACRPGRGEILLAEIKSIKEELFKRLPPAHAPVLAGESPLLQTHRGYVVQLNEYLWLADKELGFILFESKNEQRQKVFWLRRDPDLHLETLVTLNAAAPHVLATRVAPVPADRSPRGDDRVCATCDRRYLCKRLPKGGCDLETARREDAKVRG